MIKIVTPYSSLIKKKQDYNKIIRYSDFLEGRENRNFINKKKIFFFHFDIDLHKPFTIKTKKIIKSEINNLKLKLISFQLSSCYLNPKLILDKFYPFGKKISKKKMLYNCKINIQWLKKNLHKNCKIAVENNNFYNTGAYEIITNAKFIYDIVNRNNIFFLLDYAHARITCKNRKINFNKYLSLLPLHKFIQLHYTGFKIKNNVAVDSHTVPNKADYQFLKLFYLQKTNLFVTVEYYKNIEILIKILKKIKKIK